MGMFNWLFDQGVKPTKPELGMKYKDVVRLLGRGYNHIHLFGDRHFYVFKGPDRHDYTIAFQRNTVVDIKEFEKTPGYIYGE
jgi:hypothetical protein